MRTRSRLKIWFVSIISILLALTLIFLIASGVFLKRTYLKAWNTEYYKQFEDPRQQIVAHGLLAPSPYNLQMWKIKNDKNDSNTFYLYGVSDKYLPSDQTHNELIIAQGTFAEYCVQAGNELGYNVEVTPFPNGQLDENNFIESLKVTPTAKFTISKSETTKNNLYEKMFVTHSIRDPYKKGAINFDDEQKLKAVSEDFGDVELKFMSDESEIAELRDLTYRAKDAEQSSKRVMEDYGQITRLNEYTKNESPFGFTLESNGMKGFVKQISQGLVTIFPFLNKGDIAKNRELKHTKKSLDNTYTFLAIRSENNERLDQYYAGRTFAKLRLQANTMGIAVQPLSQTIAEYEEIKKFNAEYKEKFDNDGRKSIMLMRIGYYDGNFEPGVRKDVDALYNF